MQNVLLEQIEEFREEFRNQISLLKKELHNQSYPYFNSDSASEYLGVKKSYLFKLTSLKKIRYFKPEGKMMVFLKEDLDKYLLRNEYKPREIDVPKSEVISSQANQILQGLNL